MLWIIPVLFVVSTLIISSCIPYRAARGRAKALPAPTVAAAPTSTGSTNPFWSSTWSGSSGVLQCDFGTVVPVADRSVNDIVADGWTTVQLGLMAFILSVVVGIPLGIFAALGHNRWPDYLIPGISIIGVATPSFILADLLILFFSVTLEWFPHAAGRGRNMGLPDDRPGRLPDRGDRALYQGVDARGAQGLHPDSA